MSYSEDNTFEKIMARMLERDELINIDKRQGSIIYDSIAPCAMELAEAYVMMDILSEQIYLMTATGSNLDKKAYDYGITRTVATKAQRIGEFKRYRTNQDGTKTLIDMEIPVGSRFVIPNGSGMTYRYIGKIDGYKILECEITGTGGNEYTGQILPLTPITNLAEANILSTYVYGEDDETDSALRERIRKNLTEKPYGGNIADYIEKVNAIDGVGNTKVFPAWQGNGSVLLSIVDPTYNPCLPEFIRTIKRKVDPDENTGEGVGIAPIGHYVTVTTPIKVYVNINLSVEYENSYTLSEITESISEKINVYFQSVRSQYEQNTNLTIYRSRIVEKILELPFILNVPLESVTLNGSTRDMVFVDEGLLEHQYLPYVGEVTIE